MDWWAPVLIGCCSMIGAFGGIALKQIWDARNVEKDILFDVYMRLLELYGLYWWITVEELHQEENKYQDVKRKIGRLAWLISDKLREIDESDFSEKIISILFSKDVNKYPTAAARYETMSETIDRLGNYLNPNYSKIMKKISSGNLAAQVKRFEGGIPHKTIKENDPGSFL